MTTNMLVLAISVTVLLVVIVALLATRRRPASVRVVPPSPVAIVPVVSMSPARRLAKGSIAMPATRPRRQTALRPSHASRASRVA